MMNVRSLIQMHEGRIAHAYTDSLGFLTIGVGHLIDERKGGKLPEHIIDALFEHDMEEHINELLITLPWMRDLDVVRQAVLIDMYFNLRRKLLGFTKLLAQLKAGRFDGAADEMMNSLWAKQVGIRAMRLSQMMHSGEWPSE